MVPADAQNGTDVNHRDRTRVLFERIADQRSGEYHRTVVSRLSQRRVRSVVMRFVGRSLDAVTAPRVLDAGCGLGDSSRAVAGRYPKAEVLGVDFSPGTIALAQSRALPSVRFACGELTTLPVVDRWAHLTICVNTLHHVQPSEQRRALEELARVTGQDLIVEIKNADSLYFKRHSKRVEGVPITPTTSGAVSGVLADRGFDLRRTWRFLGVGWLSPLEVLWFRRG